MARGVGGWLKEWQGVVQSKEGKQVVVLERDGGWAVSNGYGNSGWVVGKGSGGWWVSAAMSGDGRTVVAGEGRGNEVYRSGNGGVDWGRVGGEKVSC